MGFYEGIHNKKGGCTITRKWVAYDGKHNENDRDFYIKKCTIMNGSYME